MEIYLSHCVITNSADEAKVLATIIILAISGLYLLFVYITAANRDAFNYNFVARSGYIKPVISDACRPILSKTDMNPHGDMRIHPPLPEYKEYGNIWFGDSGKTIMYSSEIMEYPECINYLVQSIVVAKTRKILVVYNRKNKSEELIIKNYLNNRRFGR